MHLGAPDGTGYVSSPSAQRAGLWSRERITTLATVVFACGWFWFGAAFTARESAWWTSLWVGIAIFAAATAMAARGERSRRGYGVLIISALFLLMMLVLRFA